ncbi:hypothetical protein [Vreelandella massiliensis]|uniref:hypothetical protein n=1 Tax=Vreelandella massiliensis TaxID=1816686 RepID=UPI00096AC6DF|nr:hypothetical protein [Halomonas massiliensis]
MTTDTDVTKEAADFIIKTFAADNRKVKPSHAHALISHYFGYNSKKAMIDDGDCWVDDEGNGLDSYDPDLKHVKERVTAMKSSPLKEAPTEYLADVVYAGLAPPCECCGEKSLDIMPIGDPYNGDTPEGWVSQQCASDDEGYGTCWCCGDHIIHRAEDLNAAGECPEHAGESSVDEEEQEDRESWIEYHTKDGPF